MSNRSCPLLFGLSMAAALLLGTMSKAHAVAYSWTPKSGSGNWTTSTNWSGTSATNLYPGSTTGTDTASANGDLTGNMTLNLNTSVSLSGLFLGDVATTSGTWNTTTISTANGSSLTFVAADPATSNSAQINHQGGVNNGTTNLVTPNITVNSGTFEVRTNLSQPASAQVSITLSGDVTSGAAGAHQLRHTPSSNTTGAMLLEYSGNITDGLGTISLFFRKDGTTGASATRTLKLSGTANSFTGVIDFRGGPGAVLESSPAAGTNGALGTGRIDLATTGSNATLNLGGSLSTVTEVNGINIAGAGTKRIATIGAGNRILSGTVNQGGTLALTLACSAAGDLTLSNTISGAGAITIDSAGTGKVIFGGSNTYTGATTVTQGGFLLNGSLSGSSNMSVAAAAWLGGTGTASGTATITGTLSPAATSTAGVLSLGSLVLNSTANSLIDLAAAGIRGTDYDGVSVLNSAGLTYGGTMSLAFGGSLLPDNTTFSIFSFAGSATGSFARVVSTGYYAGTWTDNLDGTYSLAKDAQTLTFTQSTGQVIVVPEPTTAVAILSGIALTVICRRARSSRPDNPLPE